MNNHSCFFVVFSSILHTETFSPCCSVSDVLVRFLVYVSDGKALFFHNFLWVQDFSNEFCISAFNQSMYEWLLIASNSLHVKIRFVVSWWKCSVRKKRRMKIPCPVWECYRICLGRLNQHNWCTGWYPNPRPSEHTVGSWCSVRTCVLSNDTIPYASYVLNQAPCEYPLLVTDILPVTMGPTGLRTAAAVYNNFSIRVRTEGHNRRILNLIYLKWVCCVEERY